MTIASRRAAGDHSLGKEDDALPKSRSAAPTNGMNRWSHASSSKPRGKGNEHTDRRPKSATVVQKDKLMQIARAATAKETGAGIVAMRHTRTSALVQYVSFEHAGSVVDDVWMGCMHETTRPIMAVVATNSTAACICALEMRLLWDVKKKC